ncbi:UNVERIFIED_CONTAM: hypothetical protein B566_EDAN017695, partial [Ephemera danica]
WNIGLGSCTSSYWYGSSTPRYPGTTRGGGSGTGGSTANLRLRHSNLYCLVEEYYVHFTARAKSGKLRAPVALPKLMSKRKNFDDLSRSQKYKRLAEVREYVLERADEASNSSESNEDINSEAATGSVDSPQQNPTPNDELGSPPHSGEPASRQSPCSSNRSTTPTSPPSSPHPSSESSSSDSNSDDSVSDDNRTFKERIADYVIESKLSRSQCAKLLKNLRTLPGQQHLPKSRKGLIKETVDRVQLKRVNPGYYYHFSIKQGLITALKETYLKEDDINEICISVNMDGMETRRANNLPGSEVFKIGLYQGSSKPESLEMFLEDFVLEMTDLIENGMEYNNKRFGVKFHCLVCDIPAKSFVLNTKGHAGLFCCTKCEIQGRRVENRSTFYDFDCQPRTDESFREKTNAEHHNGDTPLVRIPGMDMSHHRLHLRFRQAVSDCLTLLSKFIPWEFSRKCRDLKALEKYKGTELRLILYYIGPIALEKICDGSIQNRDRYLNFLTFHVACSMLSNTASDEDIDYCEALLNNFIHDFRTLYNEENVSINIHALSHLCDDVRRFGPLEQFSAFPFENANGKIRAEVKPGVDALKQIVKRHLEKNANCKIQRKRPPSLQIQIQGVLQNGETLPGFGAPFARYAIYSHWKVGTTIPNNCMFSAFRFTEPVNHTRVVPDCWIVENSLTECYYPDVEDDVYNDMAKKSTKPFLSFQMKEVDWELFTGSLLKKSVDWDTAVKKAKDDKKRNYVGNATTEEEGTPRKKSRAMRKKKRFTEFETESPKKNTGLLEFPPSPKPRFSTTQINNMLQSPKNINSKTGTMKSQKSNTTSLTPKSLKSMDLADKNVVNSGSAKLKTSKPTHPKATRSVDTQNSRVSQSIQGNSDCLMSPEKFKAAPLVQTLCSTARKLFMEKGPCTIKDFTGPSTSKDFSGPSTSKDFSGPSTSKDFSGPSTSKDFSGPSTSKDFSGPSTSKDFSGPSTGKVLPGPSTSTENTFHDMSNDGPYEEYIPSFGENDSESGSSGRKSPDDAMADQESSDSSGIEFSKNLANRKIRYRRIINTSPMKSPVKSPVPSPVKSFMSSSPKKRVKRGREMTDPEFKEFMVNAATTIIDILRKRGRPKSQKMKSPMTVTSTEYFSVVTNMPDLLDLEDSLKSKSFRAHWIKDVIHTMEPYFSKKSDCNDVARQLMKVTFSSDMWKRMNFAGMSTLNLGGGVVEKKFKLKNSEIFGALVACMNNLGQSSFDEIIVNNINVFTSVVNNGKGSDHQHPECCPMVLKE